MTAFSLWEFQKTIPHGRKLLGAYFKAYFEWKNDGQLAKTLKSKICIYSKMAGNHAKRRALMCWLFFLLNDDTKCLVWWVSSRNTEAKKARPKILWFLRMAGNHLKRCALMRWSFSILNDYTKYLVRWVNNRNTEAKKTRPKIMYF